MHGDEAMNRLNRTAGSIPEKLHFPSINNLCNMEIGHEGNGVPNMPKKIDPGYYFVGNHAVLDYINTKIAHDGQPLDLFKEISDVLDWLVLAGLHSKETVEEYAQRWKGSEEWDQVAGAAIDLRNTLASMIDKTSSGHSVSDKELGAINQLLEKRVMTTTLLQTENGFTEENKLVIVKPTDILSPIAESAIDFFSHYNLQLVKKCENPSCTLRFYDNSKNSTRRWCSQKTCGNRMKVAAFLERKKRIKESWTES
jgi:predicted RNA-binding Zn ribbon-like protein